MVLLRSDEVAIEEQRIVRGALYPFRTSKAEFADCLSNGLAGCERTASFERAAAALNAFELI